MTKGTMFQNGEAELQGCPAAKRSLTAMEMSSGGQALIGLHCEGHGKMRILLDTQYCPIAPPLFLRQGLSK